MAVTP